MALNWQAVVDAEVGPLDGRLAVEPERVEVVDRINPCLFEVGVEGGRLRYATEREIPGNVGAVASHKLDGGSNTASFGKLGRIE